MNPSPLPTAREMSLVCPPGRHHIRIASSQKNVGKKYSGSGSEEYFVQTSNELAAVLGVLALFSSFPVAFAFRILGSQYTPMWSTSGDFCLGVMELIIERKSHRPVYVFIHLFPLLTARILVLSSCPEFRRMRC